MLVIIFNFYPSDVCLDLIGFDYVVFVFVFMFAFVIVLVIAFVLMYLCLY